MIFFRRILRKQVGFVIIASTRNPEDDVMEKSYKGKLIGMIIPASLAFIVTVLCTVLQKRIIFEVGHFIAKNPQYRQVFKGRITGNTVIPFYMFFCTAAAVVTIILIACIISKKKWKTNPGSLIAPILTYSVPVVLGLIYNLLGGDKLIYGTAEANIEILTTVISLVVSPIMVVFFIFFLITMISLYDSSKKYKAASKK